MGTDTPLAVLSEHAPNLSAYFHQLFAQVTNPPIDPIREALVMSLETSVGPDGNTFDETPEQCHQLRLRGPIIDNRDVAKIRMVREGVFDPVTLSITWDPAKLTLAQAIGKAGEIAERRRQHRLDAGAHVAGKNRSNALAADGNRQRRAVDDGRGIEVAKLGTIDDVDRHAGFMGERKNLAVALLGSGGGEDERGAGEVGRGRTGTAPIAVGGDQVGAGVLVERWSEDDDLGLSLGKQSYLGGGLGPTADNHHPTAGDLVEGRKNGELARGIRHSGEKTP